MQCLTPFPVRSNSWCPSFDVFPVSLIFGVSSLVVVAMAYSSLTTRTSSTSRGTSYVSTSSCQNSVLSWSICTPILECLRHQELSDSANLSTKSIVCNDCNGCAVRSCLLDEKSLKEVGQGARRRVASKQTSQTLGLSIILEASCTQTDSELLSSRQDHFMVHYTHRPHSFESISRLKKSEKS